MTDTAYTPLTLERMRADLARVLHEDPAAIDPDDDLVDLGLDSMRAMALMVEWSSGDVEYQFSDFAAFSTLAQWWEVVSRLQAARTADS
jgi:bifunctional isochorismate lyase/aryl carrier protein